MKKSNIRKSLAVAVLTTSMAMGTFSSVLAETANRVENPLSIVENRAIYQSIIDKKIDLDKMNKNGIKSHTEKGNLVLEKYGKVVVLNFTTGEITSDGKVISNQLQKLVKSGEIYEFIFNFFKQFAPKVVMPETDLAKDITDTITKIEDGKVVNWKEIEDISEIVQPAEDKDSKVKETLDGLLKDEDLTKEILDKLNKNQDKFDEIFNFNKETTLTEKDKETTPVEKTKEEKIREELETLLKDEELSKKIIGAMEKDEDAFSKLFDLRTEEEKAKDKFLDDLTKAIKEQGDTNKVVELLEKNKDIFDKIAGKEIEKPNPEEPGTKPETGTETGKTEDPVKPNPNPQEPGTKPEEPGTEKPEKPETGGSEEPTKPSNPDQEKPVTPEKPETGETDPEKPGETDPEKPVEKTIDERVEEFIKTRESVDMGEIPTIDRNKSETGPILERTEYKDVQLEGPNGEIVTVKVKYLVGLSDESWKIVNNYRVSNGKTALLPPTESLQKSADIRAAELVYQYLNKDSLPFIGSNLIAHKRLDGRNVRDSVANYSGENILMGGMGEHYSENDDYKAAEETFTSFKNSPGHNENMLYDYNQSEELAPVRRMAISTVEHGGYLYQVQLFGTKTWGDERYDLVKHDLSNQHEFDYSLIRFRYSINGQVKDNAYEKEHEIAKRISVKHYLETGEWMSKNEIMAERSKQINSKSDDAANERKKELDRLEKERLDRLKKEEEEANKPIEKPVNPDRDKDMVNPTQPSEPVPDFNMDTIREQEEKEAAEKKAAEEKATEDKETATEEKETAKVAEDSTTEEKGMEEKSETTAEEKESKETAENEVKDASEKEVKETTEKESKEATEKDTKDSGSSDKDTSDNASNKSESGSPSVEG